MYPETYDFFDGHFIVFVIQVIDFVVRVCMYVYVGKT
jgi:hypothetical protein